jgi:hypothetical protein
MVVTLGYLFLPRKLRVEYSGAIFYGRSHGEQREATFKDNQRREGWLSAIAEAWRKMEWQKPMTNPGAIQASCMVVPVRRSLAKPTLPGSPFPRLAIFCTGHLILFSLRNYPPCDPLDSSHYKSLPDTALAVRPPCLDHTESFHQVGAVK